ncbi:xanthine/CO dehydrogenase XdhC/CoxF family maturation factor [Bacillus fengqiuensis]|nr:xanthine/CO dehydrogenase XdhC/CoxF family maturation factor [Bacillus fengqiuensis]
MTNFMGWEIFGTIEGGCGEGEVIEKTFRIIDTGRPDKHTVVFYGVGRMVEVYLRCLLNHYPSIKE